MAMVDYGAIAFKNGKLISTKWFTPMIEMVGWEDTDKDTYHNYQTDKDEPLKLVDNYFAYVGDKECTLAFYKEQIVIVSKYNDGTFGYHHEYLNNTGYTWSKWKYYFAGKSDVVVTKRNGYLVCKWKYKGDKYKVYFGYGVDLSYYKKRHIVNCFRSPEYKFYEIKHWLEDKICDWIGKD